MYDEIIIASLGAIAAILSIFFIGRHHDQTRSTLNMVSCLIASLLFSLSALGFYSAGTGHPRSPFNLSVGQPYHVITSTDIPGGKEALVLLEDQGQHQLVFRLPNDLPPNFTPYKTPEGKVQFSTIQTSPATSAD